MADRDFIDKAEEDDDLVAARWVLAVEQGLEPGREKAFHAWLSARPERAELIARQAELHELARQAARLQSARQDARAKIAGRTNEYVSRSRRRLLIGGALASGAAALAAGAAFFVGLPGGTNEAAPEAVFETATGEVRSVVLADGSRLWLDARTRVAVRLTRERRDLQLSGGRLYIEVAHDSSRPLVVHGARFEARAVGTAFEATQFEDRSGVAVAEGVVRLASGGAAVDLAAGEGGWVSTSGQLTKVVAGARSIGAWRTRRMVLADRKLDAALAELSRYFDRPLTVSNAELAARRVTVSFSIADLKAEDAARIIAKAVGADVADRATAGLLLKPAAHDETESFPPAPSPR